MSYEDDFPPTLNLIISNNNILFCQIKYMKHNTTKKIRTKFNQNLYKWSNPTQAQKMAYKYLGKTAKLYPARNPQKKYSIYDTKNEKWVNFGQIGYEDFTKHKDKNRRHNYLTRTKNMKGEWKSNKYSANNLSRNILW